MTEIEFTKIEFTPDGYSIRLWGAKGWGQPIKVKHLRGTIIEAIRVSEPVLAAPARLGAQSQKSGARKQGPARYLV
jgi:hypothetical protein